MLYLNLLNSAEQLQLDKIVLNKQLSMKNNEGNEQNLNANLNLSLRDEVNSLLIQLNK